MKKYNIILILLRYVDFSSLEEYQHFLSILAKKSPKIEKIENKISVFMELNLDFNITNERHQLVFNSLMHKKCEYFDFQF